MEFGTEWVRPAHPAHGGLRTSALRQCFDEDPVEVFKRNIFVHAFHEPDPTGLVDLIGVDNVMFGSDFPHPEGLADPLAYSELVERTMSPEDTAKVMGGNMARIMKV